ncbi:prepilin-type N-terminal cleavage/methylation domain-containing protein [uncultured Ilyobacter sp.]|uniref:type II secretion system protein n=1 Tax=uncultured Ilyobacter sp. TaxID=544433 RepID=UPI0029C0191A|nr:prepilin-type N-terminal cleavage/methylation domain-containing protein [uncultured Ilyobacter sp.]
MKRKGFTLIELVVVVAIILLLAATLAPKLRKEVAKAKDAKAVAALGSIRTAVNIFYSDKGAVPSTILGTNSDEAIYSPSATTSEYLEKDLVTFLNTGQAATATIAQAPVGGYRTAKDGGLSYGGYATYTYTSGDDLEVVIGKVNGTAGSSGSGTHDTKNNAWASY